MNLKLPVCKPHSRGKREKKFCLSVEYVTVCGGEIGGLVYIGRRDLVLIIRGGEVCKSTPVGAHDQNGAQNSLNQVILKSLGRFANRE